MHNSYHRIKEVREKYRAGLSKKNFGNGLDSKLYLEVPPYAIQNAINCIRKNLYDRRLSVNWIKEQCRLNGKNFSGNFKFYAGKSPKQFFLYHRIETAKILLKDDSLKEVSIFEIALSVGFQNHSAFTTIFKKYEGITPFEYRNNF